MGRSRTENILAVIELVVRKAQLRQKRGANVDLRGIRIYCSGGGRKCASEPDHRNPVSQRSVIGQIVRIGVAVIGYQHH